NFRLKSPENARRSGGYLCASLLSVLFITVPLGVEGRWNAVNRFVGTAMNITRKSSLVIAGTLLFIAGATAFADRAYNQDGVTAHFTPIQGVSTNAEGSGFRIAERHRGFLARDRFSAMVVLPLPSATPEIAEAKASDSGSLKAVL